MALGLDELLAAAPWGWILIGLAMGLVLVAALMLAGKKAPPPVVVKEIQLSDLSALWTKDGNVKTIHISKLSPLWRDERIIAKEKEVPLPIHPRAAAFRDKLQHWAWFGKFPQQRAVCIQLLALLDREGHCPSVVNLPRDVEGSWDENTFRILAKTTLLDHSLNVAEQVVRLLSESKAWHVIPDTMIAALAHDLGKLASLRGYLYSLGEHPLTAERPLAGMPEFNALPKKNEILRAIRLHHKMPDGLLGKTLKKADQLARQQELEAVVIAESTRKASETLPPASAGEEEPSVPDPFPKPLPLPISAIHGGPAAAWQAQADIYGETGEGSQTATPDEAPRLMDISAWFDAAQFLEGLKTYINKMYGRRFLAFSMADGVVYFQVKALEEVARRQAERAGCMEIATMAQRDLTMRQVLFTIVHHLRVEHEVIARGLIKDTFFGGYFRVTRKIGKPIKGYYTPFHAEVFGSIAEMEQAKPAMLRDIQKVSPYLDNNDTE
ncbi:MAG: HD domain-containing protein [Desulfobacteraceae bacterium]|nr:HD domain-containing protein [Desulfobacteraceae bacterium]